MVSPCVYSTDYTTRIKRLGANVCSFYLIVVSCIIKTLKNTVLNTIWYSKLNLQESPKCNGTYVTLLCWPLCMFDIMGNISMEFKMLQDNFFYKRDYFVYKSQFHIL